MTHVTLTVIFVHLLLRDKKENQIYMVRFKKSPTNLIDSRATDTTQETNKTQMTE